MKLYCSNDGLLSTSHDHTIEQSEPTGYRLIGLENLSSLISLSHECEGGNCQICFLKNLYCIENSALQFLLPLLHLPPAQQL